MKYKSLFMISLFIITALCGYSEYKKTDTNFEKIYESYETIQKNNYESDLKKYNSVLYIASYTENQYNKGTLELNAVINRDNLNDFDKDEDFNTIINDNNYFYKSVMIDNNTVLIQKNVVFQSVFGYIATKNKMSNKESIPVPSELNYDTESVNPDKYLGKFNGWHLYSYFSGM